jgi:hypothetical protein
LVTNSDFVVGEVVEGVKVGEAGLDEGEGGGFVEGVFGFGFFGYGAPAETATDDTQEIFHLLNFI